MRGGGVGARVMESSMDTAPQRTGTAWSLLADAPGECGQHVTVQHLFACMGLCGFVYNCVCVVQCVPDIILNNYGAAPMPSRERRERQEHLPVMVRAAQASPDSRVARVAYPQHSNCAQH